MRNVFVIVMIVALFSVPSASAQFLGQLSPAPTLQKGDALLGAYLGVYEDAFSIFGQFRYGIVTYFDLGFKMGMIDLDPGSGESDAGLTMGGDVKYWFMDQSSGDPLDISVGGGTEYLKVSDFSILTLGGNIITSYQIRYHDEKSVTPYGRLNIRWERQSFDKSWHPQWGGEKKNGSDNDLKVALALGAELKLTSGLFLVGELEIDNNVGFIGGINYNVF